MGQKLKADGRLSYLRYNSVDFACYVNTNEKMTKTVSDLKPGERAVVTVVGGSGALRQHFLDMGLIPGSEVTLIKFAPMGDPLELKVKGYELTLRLADAAHITVRPLAAGEEGPKIVSTAHLPDIEPVEHPGLGEGGRYHEHDEEHPLPDDVMLTFALAGNQNCGKTTLFNQLTGANQHVGNFPGVTVDGKSGTVRGFANTEITDLPGIYSLSPYTAEEVVTRRFILEQHPRGIINIVDATNIERNLYLTMQLMELNIPMVLALNMMDEVKRNGGSVRINEMEELLGIPVVPIAAAKNEGVDELIRHAIHVAHYQERPTRSDFCDEEDYGGAVHRCLHAIMHLIADHAERANLPVRFAATKIAEGDTSIIEALHLDDNERQMLEHIIVQMEQERGLDRSAAIADMRFTFIERLVARTVVKPQESVEHKRSLKIDEILTGRFTAIPSFVAIMALIFYLTFNVIGAFLQDWLQRGIDALAALTDAALTSAQISPVIHGLIIDAIFNGVGTVLSFLPIIVTLFFFLSLLEDTGYMARVAFVMDKLLRKIGLSGRSIVPLLIGFGCTVPAVMSSRTLPSARDRRLTVILTPFMSCSAKLPIYGFFTAAFFPGKGALIMTALYFFAIGVGIIVALLLRYTGFKGEAVPFVMELPNYRMPSAKNVLRLLWDKAKDFLQRAFTIIFVATIVIWFLQNFNWQLELTTQADSSLLASVAQLAAPLFAPLGFGDWRIVTALISGFMAKESVVSTLSLLFAPLGLGTVLNPLSALSLLIFCLLYTPCVAAMTTIKRELSWRWALQVAVFQLGIAWLCAFIIYHLCMAVA